MFTIDIQDFNGSWRTEVESTAWEAYVHIAGITDAAQVNVNDVNVSSLEALDAWYETQQAPATPPPAPFEDAQQTAAPADVDMGGDFDGFLTEVNAGQVKPAAQVWYTDPVTSADGEQIKARVTEMTGSGGYLIEILANGMAIADQTETGYFEGLSREWAAEKAVAYLRRVNLERAIEMDDKTESTPAKPNDDTIARDSVRNNHIARLRQRIASQERELADLRFELAQLVGE